jgi:hypothetical protein
MLYLVPRPEAAEHPDLHQIAAACDAISRLPEPLSRVLRLTISGSSIAHIAKLTGLPPGDIEQLRSTFARQIDQRARPAR